MPTEQLAAFDLRVPVGETSERVRQLAIAGEVVKCPCCSQNVSVYRRRIHASMARALIAFYRAGGTKGWTHAPSVIDHYERCEFSRLRFWGLVAEEHARRPDGGRAGFYAVTRKGINYLAGEQLVPKYVRTLNNEVLGFDGPDVSVEDALGEPFDLSELREGP